MKIANMIAWIILLIGGFNWLFVGLFGFNLVTFISFGMGIISTIIYCLVGLSALWLLIYPLSFGGQIALWNNKRI